MSMVLILFCLLCGCREMQVRASIPDVAEPQLRADFQRGVNFAHVHSRGHGYGSAVAARELDSLAAMGVTHIAITPFGYQPGALSDRLAGWDSARNEFVPRDGSMSDHDIAQQVADAHARGIAVVIKPQLWSHDFTDGGEWHGTVRQSSPTDHKTWWRSYTAFILHYARIAENSGAETVCIGTELVAMSVGHTHEWKQLIAEVRAVFSGQLTYAAHWFSEVDSIAFWGDLDDIGVNAYFPLDANDTSSVQAIAAAWQPHAERLSKLSSRCARPILFLEAGYRPARGSLREPWRYEGGTTDMTVQAKGYDALFVALADSSWFRGVYLWKAFTDPELANRYGDDGGFAFRHRPAEEIVRKWYLPARSRN